MTGGARQRLTVVIDIAKTVFHFGFIPTVLYLGELKWNIKFYTNNMTIFND